MKTLHEMTKDDLKEIKMIVFDVDGVIVPRGTKIKQIGNTTTLETKIIESKEIKQIINKKIKGFEPKEFIITIHCTEKIPEIEEIVSKDPNLYTVWNGEAYDVGVKNQQTKALGLRQTMKIFKLKKKNVMAMGDNYNDTELLKKSGISVSADKTRVNGSFFVPLEGQFLPADNLMQKILSLLD